MRAKKPMTPLAAELLELLDGENAHVRFRDVVADFPARLRGKRPRGCPHSAWQLLEHLRIAQWDILRYCVDAKHASPRWPQGYWPKTVAPPSAQAWSHSIRAYLTDQREFMKLLSDPKRNLLSPLPHAADASLLGEVCLLANHNSYHLGQFVLLRRLLRAWKPSRSHSIS